MNLSPSEDADLIYCCLESPGCLRVFLAQVWFPFWNKSSQNFLRRLLQVSFWLSVQKRSKDDSGVKELS